MDKGKGLGTRLSRTQRLSSAALTARHCLLRALSLNSLQSRQVRFPAVRCKWCWVKYNLSPFTSFLGRLFTAGRKLCGALLCYVHHKQLSFQLGFQTREKFGWFFEISHLCVYLESHKHYGMVKGAIEII